jgi:membrane protein
VKPDPGWHRSVTGVLRRTLESAVEDNISFLASALAFDLLLTAIPFVVLLLGIAGYLLQHQVVTQQMTVGELIERVLPPHPSGPGDAFAVLERLFANVVENRARLTLIAVPFFLWFSTRLFAGLRAALNEVFDTEERRSWAVGKLVDMGMVVVTAALLVGSATLTAWVSLLEAWSEWFWRLSVQVVAFASSAALFFLIFKGAPSRRIHWRTALVAALFCALGFEVAKRLYGAYLANFATLDRLASDANVAAFFLLLLWLYYTAFLFLLGGEVAEMYDLVRLRRIQRVRLG